MATLVMVPCFYQQQKVSKNCKKTILFCQILSIRVEIKGFDQVFIFKKSDIKNVLPHSVAETLRVE